MLQDAIFIALGLICGWYFGARHGRRIAFVRAAALRDALLDAIEDHGLVAITSVDGWIKNPTKRFCRALGYTESELNGRHMSELYETPELCVGGQTEQSIIRGDTWRGETRLRLREGAVRKFRTTITPLMDARGEVTQLAGIRTDMTALSLHNAALSRREGQDMSLELYVMERADGRLIYLNQAAQIRLRLRDEDYAGRQLREFAEDRSLAPYEDMLARLAQSGQDHVVFDLETEGRQAEVTLQSFETGGEALLICMVRDRSEQIAQENARSELMSTITHELRTPLTSIKGTLGLLLGNRQDLPDQAEHLLEIANKNADRLVRLINDILDWRKLNAGEMSFSWSRISVNDLMQQAVEQDQPYADQRKVQLHFHPLPEDIAIWCDPDRMLQVMSNLLSNAVKFSDQGARVWVFATAIEGHLHICVRDRGRGIDPAFIERVFDRFSQEQSPDMRAHGGTGLGLSIVKAIVERHDGWTDVSSQRGKGSTFSVHLPITGAPPSSEGQKQ